MHIQSAPYVGAFLVFCLMFLLPGEANASAIGELQSNGNYEIRTIQTNHFVKFTSDRYTWFSGDTLRTGESAAVLNLTDGGGFGFSDNTQASVALDDQGAIVVGIDSGSLIYALPDSSYELQIGAGNFTLTTRALGHHCISPPGRYVGIIEHLGDGNIKISIRSGELHVQNDETFIYRVAAGESVGLLDLPQQTVRMESVSKPGPLIEVEAPRQVAAGDRFNVQWRSTSSLEGDYLVIAERGSGMDEFESVASIIEGESLHFTSPENPGNYEVRLIDANTGAIKHCVPLEVMGPVEAGYVWDQAAGLPFSIAAGAIAVELIGEILDIGDDRIPVSP